MSYCVNCGVEHKKKYNFCFECGVKVEQRSIASKSPVIFQGKEPKPIEMPKLSDNMIDGKIARWYFKVGDIVNEDNLLAEIETDKATMEYTSFYTGTLLYIGIKEGESAPLGSLIAIIGQKDQDISKILKKYKSKKTKIKKEKPELIADPIDADGFYDMGNRFRNEKKYQESLKAFSSAINLNPDISDYYNNRADIRVILGDFEGAISDCNLGININPSEAILYFTRAEAKQGINDIDGACADMKKALNLGDEEAAQWIKENCGKKLLQNNELKRNDDRIWDRLFNEDNKI